MPAVEQAGDEPFFLYLAHYAPHTPIEAPADLVRKYETKKRAGRHRNPTYAAMIENLDRNIGRLIEHLKRAGKYENTLIVFTSDNGGYLGDAKGRNGEVTTNAPLRSGKGSLYEGGIRVPLIIKLPGQKSQSTGSEMIRTISERVVLTDLHHVIISLAGIVSSESGSISDSVDWSANLKNAQLAWPLRTFYFHYPHYYETTTPVSAMIEKGQKILHFSETGRTELFDLESDPSETTDLAENDPQKTAKMLERLNHWKKQVGAKEPVPNPAFTKEAGR